MKRFAVLLIISLLLLTLLGGCAASSTTFGNSQPTQPAEGGGDQDYSGQPSGDLVDYQRKVIKNVAMELKTKDVRATYAQILAYAEAKGGYEFSRNQQTYDSLIEISAQIKIDPRYLDDLAKYIASVSDVISEKTSSSDITADYFDAKTRLDTLEKTLLTYYEFLGNAKNIDESLKVQNQIDELTLQIETLKGRISLWDSLLAESTVSITLRQAADPVGVKRDINWSTLSFDDMGYLIQAGFTSVLNVIVIVLQWAAIIIVVSSPLWIIALAVILIVRRRQNKRRIARETAKMTSEITQAPEQNDPAEKREG